MGLEPAGDRDDADDSLDILEGVDRCSRADVGGPMGHSNVKAGALLWGASAFGANLRSFQSGKIEAFEGDRS